MARRKKSKMDAMRQTLAALGADAKPLAIQEHLKSQFGLDMSTSHISNYKSVIAKKGGKRRRRRRKRLMVAKAPANRSGISMADIQAVKALTDRIGVKKVKELAAVLAK